MCCSGRAARLAHELVEAKVYLRCLLPKAPVARRALSVQRQRSVLYGRLLVRTCHKSREGSLLF